MEGRIQGTKKKVRGERMETMTIQNPLQKVWLQNGEELQDDSVSGMSGLNKFFKGRRDLHRYLNSKEEPSR